MKLLYWLLCGMTESKILVGYIEWEERVQNKALGESKVEHECSTWSFQNNVYNQGKSIYIALEGQMDSLGVAKTFFNFDFLSTSDN